MLGGAMGINSGEQVVQETGHGLFVLGIIQCPFGQIKSLSCFPFV